jgi:hypothetical protein
MLTRLKREPTEWKKIFVIYLAHKRLITRIYRELKKLNCQRVNYPMNNWASELNRSLSKEEVQMAKTTKKCSTYMAIKEMQIETTLQFHLTLVRMGIIQDRTTNVGKDGGRPTYTVVTGKVYKQDTKYIVKIIVKLITKGNSLKV